MAKPRTRYVCENCGATQPRWMGRCPECGEWNTLLEQAVEGSPRGSGAARAGRGPLLLSRAQPLATIAPEGEGRLSVPMEELSRVLGGGIVPGGVVLIGGDPGIGKSTLLLQLAGMLGRAEAPVLYVSGEESLQQIKMRAERLGIAGEQLLVLAETKRLKPESEVWRAVLASTGQPPKFE